MGPDVLQFAAQSQDEIQAFTRQVVSLFHQALPDPSDTKTFNRLMSEARATGLNWWDGLEYVARHRGESCG